MPKLDCGGVLSLIYFSTGGECCKKRPRCCCSNTNSIICESCGKERNRELLSICYVCTDMNRKLSMLYGAILIIHFKPIDPISHIYHFYHHRSFAPCSNMLLPQHLWLKREWLDFLEESSQRLACKNPALSRIPAGYNPGHCGILAGRNPRHSRILAGHRWLPLATYKG
jgi:hypothetical protein